MRDTVGCVLIATAFMFGAACASAGRSASPSSMLIVPFEDARFESVRPGLDGAPEIAVLWGDPASGPSAMLMRLRRGPIPLHTHTNDYQLVVVEGTMKHWGRMETEATARPLGPGSSWSQPGGAPHAEACLTDTCLLHIVWSGKQDGQVWQDRSPQP